MAEKKKVVIIGSGGVGSVLALGLESTKQVEVTLIVRSDYDHVTKNGYNFDSVDYGEVKNWRPSHVARSVEDSAQYGPFDYIFVATKFIPDIQKSEDLVRPLVHDGVSIVLVQNGVGNEPPVAKAHPNAYVIGGVAMVGSTNRGGVVHQPTPDWTTFGTFDKRPEAIKATKDLVEIYSQSKSRIEFTDDLKFMRWKKLVYNSSFNPIAALTGTDTGRMFFAGLDKTVIMPAMKEVRAIAEAETKRTLPEGIEEFMLYSDESKYYEPSMLVDMQKGQILELEAIVGNPLRYAARHNIDAPILKMLYLLLRAPQYRLLEKRGIAHTPKSFNRREDTPFFNTLPWEEKETTLD